MRKRRLNSGHTSDRSPLPQQSLMRCCGFSGMRRSVYQVAAKLADILKQRAIPLDNVIPEAARRESRPDHHRPSLDEHRSNSHHAADTVIHRQTIQHPVGWTSIHQARKPIAPLHQPEMADVRGFGQAGRTRSVNVERAILDIGRRIFERRRAGSQPHVLCHDRFGETRRLLHRGPRFQPPKQAEAEPRRDCRRVPRRR